MFKISRKLAAVSSGFVAATILIVLGSVPTSTDESNGVKMDIVGDSHSSGEGKTFTYFGPEDPRHRSAHAAGAQVMQRVQDSNTAVRVDGATGASSGATTKKLFEIQPGFSPGPVINTLQRDQIRPDVDALIVGSGGDDARFAEVLPNSVTSVSGATFERSLENLGPLPNSQLSDEEYTNQAANSQPGEASTVTARLLRTLKALQQRAPGAKLVVPNYPPALDPNVKEPFYSGFSRHELERIQKLVSRLNAAMAKAVEVCGCAELADVFGAMKGREVCTENPALTDLGVRFTGSSSKWSQNELFHPNIWGGALMSDAIAKDLAKALGLKQPSVRGAELTPFKELRQAVLDADGDGVDARLPAGDRGKSDSTGAGSWPGEGATTAPGKGSVPGKGTGSVPAPDKGASVGAAPAASALGSCAATGAAPSTGMVPDPHGATATETARDQLVGIACARCGSPHVTWAATHAMSSPAPAASDGP